MQRRKAMRREIRILPSGTTETLHLHKLDGDWIEWINYSDHDSVVQFKDSPFYPDTFLIKRGESTPSGPIKPAANGDYAYAVQPVGVAAMAADPHVIVH
jgi:hypothetical protein